MADMLMGHFHSSKAHIQTEVMDKEINEAELLYRQIDILQWAQGQWKDHLVYKNFNKY